MNLKKEVKGLNIELVPQVFMTPTGNVRTYAVKINGLCKREYLTLEELRAFLRGLGVENGLL